MKLILAISFVIISISGDCQVPFVNIKNETLIKVVDSVLKISKISETTKCVIVLNFENLENRNSEMVIQTEEYGKVIKTHELVSYVLRVSLRQDVIFFEYNVPSFYSLYRERLVLFYTGVEGQVEFSSSHGKNLYKKIVKNLSDTDGKVLSPVCWIKVEGEQFSFIAKL